MGATKTELHHPEDVRIATLAKALGHPARIAILRHLLSSKTCITGDLSDVIGLSQPTISQHLRELKSIGILKGRVLGSAVNYCINPEQWDIIATVFANFFSQEIHQIPCEEDSDPPSISNAYPESRDREEELRQIASAIAKQILKKSRADLMFVCTHNSRRSQFAQAWCHTLSAELGLPVKAWSGGTEITACNERTIEALTRKGFKMKKSGAKENPHYQLWRSTEDPCELYSKRLTDEPKPGEGFIAIMNCTAADDACPFVEGAEHRFSLPYEDPGKWDGGSDEQYAYDTCCTVIKQEMEYLLEMVHSLI